MGKTVITGATGLLGGNLAVELARQGHEVRATRRGKSRAAHLADVPIEWVEGDLGDEDALARAFAGADAVFHCAAQVSIRRRATPAMIAAVKAGADVNIGISHENYEHEVRPLPREIRDSLAADLA